MKENGIVIGIVSDLEDPDKLGRIKVKYPHLEERQSQWARLASPMAGKDRGIFFRPEKDDEVLVGFLQGDARFPYILGSLWNQPDPPPKDDGKAKENNWRFIKSRSGHIFKLDDTKSKEKIEIIDKDEKHKIVIDCSGDKIEIICTSGDVEIKAEGKVNINANEISMTSKTTMMLKAEGEMTIKGSMVNIN